MKPYNESNHDNISAYINEKTICKNCPKLSFLQKLAHYHTYEF